MAHYMSWLFIYAVILSYNVILTQKKKLQKKNDRALGCNDPSLIISITTTECHAQKCILMCLANEKVYIAAIAECPNQDCINTQICCTRGYQHIQANSDCFGCSCFASTAGYGAYSNCVGDGCIANCKGNRCISQCTGNRCSAVCTGDRCISRCSGRKCKTQVKGFHSTQFRSRKPLGQPDGLNCDTELYEDAKEYNKNTFSYTKNVKFSAYDFLNRNFTEYNMGRNYSLNHSWGSSESGDYE